MLRILVGLILGFVLGLTVRGALLEYEADETA